MLSILLAIAVAVAAPRPLTVGPGEAALVFGLPAVNEAQAIQVVNKTQVSLGDFAGVMPSQPRKRPRDTYEPEELEELEEHEEEFEQEGFVCKSSRRGAGDPGWWTPPA